MSKITFFEVPYSECQGLHSLFRVSSGGVEVDLCFSLLIKEQNFDPLQGSFIFELAEKSSSLETVLPC